MTNNTFKNILVRRIKSFGYAFKGLRLFLITQPNAWIHILAVIVVVSAGFYFSITIMEWSICLLCFGLVFTAEIINTAIEYLVDHVTPEFHPKAGAVKDLAAAAVLVASGFSALIGVIIFYPYIAAWINS